MRLAVSAVQCPAVRLAASLAIHLVIRFQARLVIRLVIRFAGSPALRLAVRLGVNRDASGGNSRSACRSKPRSVDLVSRPFSEIVGICAFGKRCMWR